MVFGFLRNQFIDVIEWANQDNATLAWRFPTAENEIKNGAQLTVREGQWAVFLNEGQFADVFKPGRHTLSTQNLPVLTSLGAWRHGFNSPFKADIVFLANREFRAFKWGTPQPIVLRDADFGVVRVRAFGGFGLRIIDPKDFIRECAGVRESYQAQDIEETVRRLVVSKFTDALAEMKVAALDLATKYDELGQAVLGRIARSFDQFGLELTFFSIESVNMPEEVQAAIDEQSRMNLMMSQQQKFASWQVLKGVSDSSGGAGGGQNPMRSLASDLAVGQAMGQVVSNAINSSGIGQAAQGSQTDGARPQQANPGVASGDLKFCQECGVQGPRTAKFCPACGHKFE